MVKNETCIVTIEIKTKDAELTTCPEELGKYKEELIVFLAEKMKCDPKRLVVLSMNPVHDKLNKERHGNTCIYVQVTPVDAPDPKKGYQGLPSRMLANDLETLLKKMNIRNLPNIPTDDHFKPVRQAKQNIKLMRHVHKLVESIPNISQKEAISRIKLGSSAKFGTRELPPVTVIPSVQKSEMLEGADAVAMLKAKNDKLELLLWDKNVAFEVHIVSLFDKLTKRKMWLLWHANVVFERKGLKVMRRMLKQAAWKCLQVWERQYLEAKHYRTVLNKVLRTWRNKALRGAWHTWMAWHNEEKRRRLLKVKIVKQWMQKTLRLAWHSWSSGHEGMKRDQHMMSKVMGNWRHKSIRNSWHTWIAWHAEERHHHLIGLKIMSRMLKKAAYNCLQLWCLYYFENR